MITTDVNLVVEALGKGEIAAIPTETVYGLAANAYQEKAIEKVFSLKKRPTYNPLIVHIASPDALKQVALNIPAKAQQLADAFWPGPLTLVLQKQDQISNLVTAGKPTVAVRVPDHRLTLKLLNSLAFPLAAPSANPFGSISPTSAEHVKQYFKTNLDFILDGGKCSRGLESTIIGFENDAPILYRFGSLAQEDIEKVVGPIKIKNQNDSKPSAPGMLSRHYAPKTPTFLTHDVLKTIKKNNNKKIGLISFQKIENISSEIKHEVLSSKGNLKEAAKKLYAAMHHLDQQNLEVIIAQYFPEKGLGKTINDRLKRAVKK